MIEKIITKVGNIIVAVLLFAMMLVLMLFIATKSAKAQDLGLSQDSLALKYKDLLLSKDKYSNSMKYAVIGSNDVREYFFNEDNICTRIDIFFPIGEKSTIYQLMMYFKLKYSVYGINNEYYKVSIDKNHPEILFSTSDENQISTQ